ncbi:MAG TPA: polynucleotide adenylyltransferase PcnB [Ideonella sp.]|uniref:polynucleotide adenylyltransferase PcnB n=1 Tax=Ideonella sp. TaxID=1929293 RepID=UPI002CA1928D|nr:polynucleotide adenylyltransferase PcnB [Ideonella sp.]HSI46913.1 polynucleotide adenylyltransferase PcnB [Ideonella sp.]
MIRKFIDKLLGKPADGSAKAAKAAKAAKTGGIPLGKRTEVPESEHGIDASLLDERAVRVVTTLQQAGYEAYIVGGAVRDLMVNRRPKDFDVATNATPEQVKGLFRRAFIIGRRFRIVHVIHGRGRDHEVIEVSTFRAYMDNSAAEQVEGNEKTSRDEMAGKSHVVDASGRVLRDNVWGPQIEDAARRDFTVNAMYYDPSTRIVIDYHGGIKDSQARVLRMIGDPETRYREDPVRILRVVRFAAKLGFTIEPKTQKPLKAMAATLANVPASRMFDEMIKLLQTGHALDSLAQLKAQGLDRGLFPVLDAVLTHATAGSPREKFVHLALKDTDRRVAEGKAVAPSFMLACMLWHDVQENWTRLRDAGEHPMPALSQAIDAVFDARIGDISGRGKLATDMREIWMMQPRFERRTGAQAYGLVEQPRFRAGFDFLRLRADVGEAPADLAEWWEDFSLGNDAEREALVDAVRDAPRPRRSPKPRRTPAEQAEDGTPAEASDEAGDDESDDQELAEPGTGDAPRKKRRRRRKPSGARTGARSGDTGSGPAGGGGGGAGGEA